MRMSKKARNLWAGGVLAAAVAAGVGYALHWYGPEQVTESFSNISGYVLVSADGRTITATAPGPDVGCLDNATTDLVATEIAHTVELRVRARIVHGAGTCVTGSYAIPPALSVTLAQPLWGRTLINGDGKPLAFFDGRTELSPHPLPSGFHLFRSGPGADYAVNPQGGAAMMYQFYEGPEATLHIAQQIGTTWRAPQCATRLSDVSVNGHAGHACDESGAATVEWIQNGQVVQVVYRANSDSSNGSVLATALAIARTVR